MRPGEVDDPSKPIAVKIPSWQTATLLIVAAAALFLTIYPHFYAGLRILCGMAGVAALVGAVVAYRAFLVVDEEGIGTRGWFGEHSVDWADLNRLEVAPHRGSLTVRVVRENGSTFDVPPALVLPLKPTSRYRTIAQLEQLIRHITSRWPR